MSITAERKRKLEEHEANVRENVLPRFEEDLDEFTLDDCEQKTRDGKTRYPFEGMKVWLLPYGSGAIESGLAQFDEDLDAEGMDTLAVGLSTVIAGWTVLDVRGLPRPQPFGNPKAVKDLPTALQFHLVTLHYSGESKAARKNVSSGGRDGSTTRQSTEETTPS